MRLIHIVLLACFAAAAPAQVALFPGAGGYFENFESGPGNWALAPGSVGTAWQHGTPAGSVINTASSGSNVFMTSLAGNYVDNTLTSIDAVFDLTSYAGFPDPILSLQLWYDSENGWDGANVQMDSGSGFAVVGAVGDPGWYFDTDVDGLGNGVDGWSGASAGWTQMSHTLDGAAGHLVTLRISFGSDGSVSGYDGVAVDDIAITDAPIPLYPGTNEDLEATLDVNLAGPVIVDVGAEQAQIQIGDYVEYACTSPGATLVGLDFIVVASTLVTGMPIPQLFPGLHIDPATVVVINRSLSGVLPLLPTNGFNFAFVHPGGSFSGLSVYVQSLVSTATATNGIFVATNAIEMQMQ